VPLILGSGEAPRDVIFSSLRKKEAIHTITLQNPKQRIKENTPGGKRKYQKRDTTTDPAERNRKKGEGALPQLQTQGENFSRGDTAKTTKKRGNGPTVTK